MVLELGSATYFFLMYIIVLCLFHRMLLYVYYIGLLKRYKV